MRTARVAKAAVPSQGSPAVGFDFRFARPQAAFIAEMKERFSASAAAFNACLVALEEAQRAGHTIYALRAMAELTGEMYGFWHGLEISQEWGRTTEVVLCHMITDQ